jgi:hypothetical protein
LESLDPKPELKKLNGQPFPESFTKGQQLAQLQGAKLVARGSFVEFAKHGQSGQEISSLFPWTAKIADISAPRDDTARASCGNGAKRKRLSFSYFAGETQSINGRTETFESS